MIEICRFGSYAFAAWLFPVQCLGATALAHAARKIPTEHKMTPFQQARFQPSCQRLEERTTPTAGQLDPTFGSAGLTTTDIRFQPVAEVALANGQYLAAGTTESLYLTDFVVARFNADGSLDTTFGKAGYSGLDFDNSADYVNDLVVQSDGKILVLGSSSKTVGGVYKQEFALARFNADGSLDTGFGTGGTVVLDPAPGSNDFGQIQTAILQTGGKIVLVGDTSGASGSNNVTLVRLNPNGSVDTSYGSGGIARPDLPYASNLVATALSDGRIAVSGQASDPTNNTTSITVIRADGTLDTTFGTNGQAQLTGVNPRALAQQADGKVLVAGDWNSGGSSGSDFVVLRLNGDGSADTEFGVNGRVTTDFQEGFDTAHTLAVQPDGKILVGGASSPSGYIPVDPPIAFPPAVPALVVPVYPQSRLALVRYNADGSLDTSFGVAGRALTQVASASINRLVVQADGTIMAIGPVPQFFYPFYGDAYLNGALTFVRFQGTGARTRYIATGADAGGGPHSKSLRRDYRATEIQFLRFRS